MHTLKSVQDSLIFGASAELKAQRKARRLLFEEILKHYKFPKQQTERERVRWAVKNATALSWHCFFTDFDGLKHSTVFKPRNLFQAFEEMRAENLEEILEEKQRIRKLKNEFFDQRTLDLLNMESRFMDRLKENNISVETLNAVIQIIVESVDEATDETADRELLERYKAAKNGKRGATPEAAFDLAMGEKLLKIGFDRAGASRVLERLREFKGAKPTDWNSIYQRLRNAGL